MSGWVLQAAGKPERDAIRLCCINRILEWAGEVSAESGSPVRKLSPLFRMGEDGAHSVSTAPGRVAVRGRASCPGDRGSMTKKEEKKLKVVFCLGNWACRRKE